MEKLAPPSFVEPPLTVALSAAEAVALLSGPEPEYQELVLPLQLGPTAHEAGLVEVIPVDPYPEMEFKQPNTANAEIFDGLKTEVMTAAYEVADEILETNRQLLRDGRFESVPLDVDALGTAKKLKETERKYGKRSPEYRNVERGYSLDKDRKLDEAESQNGINYFEPIVYEYHPAEDTVYADGMSYDEMVVNGLSPLANAEEIARRRHDFAKADLEKALIKEEASEHVAVVQITPCAEHALESYKARPKGSHGGYAPKVDKLMVHFDTFDPKQRKIYHEQVALPGKDYLTPGVINKGLQRINAARETEELDRTEIYGTQEIVEREEFDTVWDVVAVLDEVASEESGLTIFMGMTVSEDHPRDYKQVEAQARIQREKRQKRTEKLKEYTLGLEEQGIDHTLGTVMETKFIKDLLLDAAQHEPELALKAFDHETALGFQQAQALRAQGRIIEAQALIDDTRLKAPEVGGCGAGSCGLEELNPLNTIDQIARKLLDVQKGELVVKDKVRKCKKGHDIYYAYTAKTVKKACVQCGELEKDGKLIKSRKQSDGE